MRQREVNINWLRVLLFVLLFCIIATIVYASILYRTIEKDRTTGFESAEQFVLKNSDIAELSEATYFQAEEGYFTFVATGADEEALYVFLRDEETFKEEDLYILSAGQFVPVEELEGSVLTDCAKCSLLNSTLAMIDEVPLWELTYTDDANRYVIEYKYLENGKTFEKLRLTRKFTKE
ncbi:MAG TPA: hypothetical protein VFF20_09760 [Pseudogracilibacillus sp.]|nr:hypothetical protein [Pseudogracilibacillus sp.]